METNISLITLCPFFIYINITYREKIYFSVRNERFDGNVMSRNQNTKAVLCIYQCPQRDDIS